VDTLSFCNFCVLEIVFKLKLSVDKKAPFLVKNGVFVFDLQKSRSLGTIWTIWL